MVGLEIEANQSENLMKRSARGEFDLAFFKQETGAKHGTVTLREQLVWVSGANYLPDTLQSMPLILFPEGCAYRRCAIAALGGRKAKLASQLCQPEFRMPEAAASEGMGITVLARSLVAPPLRIISHGMRLPELPTVELVYSQGRHTNSRVVGELATYLADSLATPARCVRRRIVA